MGKKIQLNRLREVKEQLSSTNAIGQMTQLVEQIQQRSAKVPEKSLKIFTNFMANRGALRGFQQRTGKLTEGECRYCGIEKENCIHILATCPALTSARSRHLKDNFLHPNTISATNPSNIVNFIEEIGVMNYEREE
eukprot:sb/3474653/